MSKRTHLPSSVYNVYNINVHISSGLNSDLHEGCYLYAPQWWKMAGLMKARNKSTNWVKHWHANYQPCIFECYLQWLAVCNMSYGMKLFSDYSRDKRKSVHHTTFRHLQSPSILKNDCLRKAELWTLVEPKEKLMAWMWRLSKESEQGLSVEAVRDQDDYCLVVTRTEERSR